jgi:cell division protein ZapA
MTAERHSTASNSDLSRVTVTINGRKFRMACEDGQEAHLRRLASDFDQRIGRLRSEFGEIGNTRLTVMAALTISDELVQMGGRLRALERELAALQDTRAAAADHARATQAAVAAALNSAAERIEGITRRLNRTLPPDEGSARGSMVENRGASDRAVKAVPSMVAAGRSND